MAPSSTKAAAFDMEFSGDLSIYDDVSVLLWMPSMGHGSAPVKLDKLGPAQFRVTNVYFIMPGDWEIRLSLKTPTIS